MGNLYCFNNETLGLIWVLQFMHSRCIKWKNKNKKNSLFICDKTQSKLLPKNFKRLVLGEPLDNIWLPINQSKSITKNLLNINAAVDSRQII